MRQKVRLDFSARHVLYVTRRGDGGDADVREYRGQVAETRRDLWSVFNRTQENLIKGGLSARAANGRRQTTRPVQGIDNGIRLNRALWLLADGLRQLKA
ncbi:DUF932 domain-containing protein [Burkholderia pseudomallei]|uniref:DUF932 domain-containing protein n=1 Tax=Burkholderia pseudomallei TaxID=28450 RepID=UPI001560E8AC|nr:DUF932 domain-containing protein [Burkholderia pseudomallei]NRE31720.1 DUF932 domain-containing protein [Burkholderia pseudomallei]